MREETKKDIKLKYLPDEDETTIVITDQFNIFVIKDGYTIDVNSGGTKLSFRYFNEGEHFRKYYNSEKRSFFTIREDNGSLLGEKSEYLGKVPYFDSIMSIIEQLEMKRLKKEQDMKNETINFKIEGNNAQLKEKNKSDVKLTINKEQDSNNIKGEFLTAQSEIKIVYNQSDNSYQIDNGKIKGKLYLVSLEHKTYLGQLDIKDGVKTKYCTLQKDGTIKNGAYQIIDKFEGIDRLISLIKERQLINNAVKPMGISDNRGNKKDTLFEKDTLFKIDVSKLQIEYKNYAVTNHLKGVMHIKNGDSIHGWIPVSRGVSYKVTGNGALFDISTDKYVGIDIKDFEKSIENHFKTKGLKKVDFSEGRKILRELEEECKRLRENLMITKGSNTVVISEYRGRYSYNVVVPYGMDYYTGELEILRNGYVLNNKTRELVDEDILSIKLFLKNQIKVKREIEERKKREYEEWLYHQSMIDKKVNSKISTNAQSIVLDTKQEYKQEEPTKVDILKFVFSGRIRHQGNTSFIEDSRGEDVGKIHHYNYWSSICDVWGNEIGKMSHYENWSSVEDVWGNEVGRLRHQGDWSFIEDGSGKDYGKLHTDNGLARIDR